MYLAGVPVKISVIAVVSLLAGAMTRGNPQGLHCGAQEGKSGASCSKRLPASCGVTHMNWKAFPTPQRTPASMAQWRQFMSLK